MNLYEKNFLIITAHPDDLEMACGGLVAKIKENGGTVTNLILVKPSAEVKQNRNVDIVTQELQQSEKILGFKSIVYDTPLHANGRPNLTMTNNLVTYAESIAHGQDILVSHWKEDHHKDHKVCYDVARSIARKNFEQFWCMDEPPYNLHYKNFNCNQYVDITDYVDIKKSALKSYATYFDAEDISTIIDYNKYRGSFLGAGKVAETFQIMYNKI